MAAVLRQAEPHDEANRIIEQNAQMHRSSASIQDTPDASEVVAAPAPGLVQVINYGLTLFSSSSSTSEVVNSSNQNQGPRG